MPQRGSSAHAVSAISNRSCSTWSMYSFCERCDVMSSQMASMPSSSATRRAMSTCTIDGGLNEPG
eukprot:266335-Prymnesium_polylepis.1